MLLDGFYPLMTRYPFLCAKNVFETVTYILANCTCDPLDNIKKHFKKIKVIFTWYFKNKLSGNVQVQVSIGVYRVSLLWEYDNIRKKQYANNISYNICIATL